ncbi:MAG: hypothetical protein MJ252_10695 [archaeon]|nr:hypothetical protein [archaeon]
MSTTNPLTDPIMLQKTKEILDWVNNLLSLRLNWIEQLATGAVYCQILDAMYNGKVRLSKVKWNAKTEAEFLENFSILTQGFNDNGISKSIDVSLLAKGSFQDNFELLEWFKQTYEANRAMQKQNKKFYDAKKRRGNQDLTYLAEKQPEKKNRNFSKGSMEHPRNVARPRGASKSRSKSRDSSKGRSSSNDSNGTSLTNRGNINKKVKAAKGNKAKAAKSNIKPIKEDIQAENMTSAQKPKGVNQTVMNQSIQPKTNPLSMSVAQPMSNQKSSPFQYQGQSIYQNTIHRSDIGMKSDIKSSAFEIQSHHSSAAKPTSEFNPGIPPTTQRKKVLVLSEAKKAQLKAQAREKAKMNFDVEAAKIMKDNEGLEQRQATLDGCFENGTTRKKLFYGKLEDIDFLMQNQDHLKMTRPEKYGLIKEILIAPGSTEVKVDENGVPKVVACDPNEMNNEMPQNNP